MSRKSGTALMRTRIAPRVWVCKCCGKENDQRGCVKGPPQCFCEKRPDDFGGILGDPLECKQCGKCPTHCFCNVETCICTYAKSFEYMGHFRECPARKLFVDKLQERRESQMSEQTINVGDVVVYHDAAGHPHNALVLANWGQPGQLLPIWFTSALTKPRQIVMVGRSSEMPPPCRTNRTAFTAGTGVAQTKSRIGSLSLWRFNQLAFGGDLVGTCARAHSRWDSDGLEPENQHQRL